MVDTLRCGPTQAVSVRPNATANVQSGWLQADSNGVWYIQTAGKTYELDVENPPPSVKKDLAKVSNSGPWFANVKGKLAVIDGREVFKATSITGEKPMTGIMGDVSFPRCPGGSPILFDGTKSIKLEPMTDDLKVAFSEAPGRGGFPVGTNFVGVKKGDVLQVWDLAFRMYNPPPSAAADSFDP
jgi:hypothetical protein